MHTLPATTDPRLPWRLVDTHRQSGSVSCAVTAPFSWFWCIKDFFCTLQESVSPVLCKFCNQTSIHTSDLFICTSVLFLAFFFFSQFWLMFTLITLNFFSGRLPISLSFIWSYGFLQCSFICCMFLCLFLSFNLLCLESPFFRLEGLNSSLL